MKVNVTNNRQADYGVELAGGGYAFIAPGKTRTVDAANPSALYQKDFLDVEAADSEVKAPPASLKKSAAKVGEKAILDVEEVLQAEVVQDKRDPLDHDRDGRRGGSKKGGASTSAKGARRRRKAAGK